MSHAVLQTDLITPSVEQLRRALRSVPGLTPYDASILGHDAFGILVKNFPPEWAAALQRALHVEGVVTEIIDQSLLPELPPKKLVQRLDCRPEHLLIYDPLGNTFALDWRHVLFIAAGAVRLTEFVRHQQKRLVTRHHGDGQTTEEMEYETVSREERNFHLVAEIFITGAVLRYSVTADKFNFAYLGDRNTGSLVANFSLFVRDLIQFSPHAVLNTGAEAMRAAVPAPFSYPTRNAFQEEMIWRLWQMKKTL